MFQERPPIVFMYVLEIGSLLITATWPSKTDTINVSFERVLVPRIYPFRSKVRSSHTMRCESWIIAKLSRFQIFISTKRTKEAVNVHGFQNFVELLLKEVYWISIGCRPQQNLHDTGVQESTPTYYPVAAMCCCGCRCFCLLVWVFGVGLCVSCGMNYCVFLRFARQTITRLDPGLTQPLNSRLPVFVELVFVWLAFVVWAIVFSAFSSSKFSNHSAATSNPAAKAQPLLREQQQRQTNKPKHNYIR